MPPLYGLACVSARVPVSYRMAPERPRSHRVHFSGGSCFFVVSLGAGVCGGSVCVCMSGVERLGLVGTPLLRAGAAHRECPGDSGLGRVHEFGPSPLSSDSVISPALLRLLPRRVKRLSLVRERKLSG